MLSSGAIAAIEIINLLVNLRNIICVTAPFAKLAHNFIHVYCAINNVSVKNLTSDPICASKLNNTTAVSADVRNMSHYMTIDPKQLILVSHKSVSPRSCVHGDQRTEAPSATNTIALTLN